jgi:hypothetical protein
MSTFVARFRPDRNHFGEIGHGKLLFSATDQKRQSQASTISASALAEDTAKGRTAPSIYANDKVVLRSLQMTSLFTKQPETKAHSEHREGPLARSIEQQTAKLPSDLFLWLALGSIGGSLV